MELEQNTPFLTDEKETVAYVDEYDQEDEEEEARESNKEPSPGFIAQFLRSHWLKLFRFKL